MNPNSNISLALFLSRSVPLSLWDRLGILERELALYRQLRPALKSLTIVTCGGPAELKYQDMLSDTLILCNRWGLSPNAYSLLAPLLHRRALQQATLYKTNQLEGAWTALLAGRLYRKPVIVRAGYAWALNYRRAQGKETFKGRVICRLERLSASFAGHMIVTTNSLKNYFVSNYQISPQLVTIIPNYVDTHLFQPLTGSTPQPGRVIFAGSLRPEKNLPTLFEAAAQLKSLQLVLAGDGPQKAQLEQLAQRLNLCVTFAGRLPNQHLPQEINRSEIFILPSLYEGHPKALIEAMACGAAVIGADVDGIRNVIEHEVTGLLCSPTIEGIKTALARLLADRQLRARLGQAARAFAAQHYSLEQVAAQELALLQEVQQNW